MTAAPAAAGERVVLAAAGDLGLVDLDEPGQRAAAGRHHAAAQLGADQPGRLVRAQGELALQLQGRDAVGVGRHQIGRPEPGGQRQLGVVHNGAGGDRGLFTAACAFPGPGFGLQLPGFGFAAAGADEAVRPARCGEIGNAGRLIREALLEFDQRAGKIGHRGLSAGAKFVICSYHDSSRFATTNCVTGCRGISLLEFTNFTAVRVS